MEILLHGKTIYTTESDVSFDVVECVILVVPEESDTTIGSTIPLAVVIPHSVTAVGFCDMVSSPL
jgi:hypothetical protein